MALPAAREGSEATVRKPPRPAPLSKCREAMFSYLSFGNEMQFGGHLDSRKVRAGLAPVSGDIVASERLGQTVPRRSNRFSRAFRSLKRRLERVTGLEPSTFSLATS